MCLRNVDTRVRPRRNLEDLADPKLISKIRFLSPTKSGALATTAVLPDGVPAESGEPGATRPANVHHA